MTPDPERIDAWLAGTLNEEEAAELEQYFDANPPIVEQAKVVDDESVKLHEIVSRVLPEKIGVIEDVRDLLKPIPGRPDLLGRLGDYEASEVIATGGMGIVLHAHDPELDRRAALKVLSPEMASNRVARSRFLREARAAAKLEHENILPIYGVHAEAVPWYAMRYVGGGSLQDALDAGETFDLPRLKSIGIQVAAALGAAHAAGIIHRDIKPANILLEGDGSARVWVGDFGIARCADDPSLTYAGGIAGTPHYMSPEQAAGGELDGRSDLFSLGSVLYRCATGRKPFEGDTTGTVIENVASSRPPSVTKFPDWFANFLDRLLAKNPVERFATASDVISALENGTAGADPRRGGMKRRVFLLGAASIGFAGTLAAWNKFSSTPAEATDGFPLSIRGQKKGFETFADAINAARSGDTILVRGQAPILVDGIEIPIGKTLSIEGVVTEDGQIPVLTTLSRTGPGLLSHADLTLNSLELRLENQRPGSKGIISTHAAALRMQKCKVSARREITMGPYSENKPRAIELLDGASAKIVDCEFDLQHTFAFLINDEGKGDSSPARTTTLEISGGESFAAFYAVVLGFHHAADRPIVVRANGVSFTGESFFKSSKRSDLPSIELRSDNCEFDIGRAFCWLQMNQKAPIQQRLRWVDGVGNRFIQADRPEIFYGQSSSSQFELTFEDLGQ